MAVTLHCEDENPRSDRRTYRGHEDRSPPRGQQLAPVSARVSVSCELHGIDSLSGLNLVLGDYRVRTIMHCPSELVEHFCPPLPSLSMLMYLMKCPMISVPWVEGSLLHLSPGNPVT